MRGYASSASAIPSPSSSVSAVLLRPSPSLSCTIATVIAWSAVLVPSLTETVAVYEDLVAKSGALSNISTPSESIDSSVPETLKLSDSLSSVAVTVPIASCFSRALKLALDVKTGSVVSTTLTTRVALPVLPAVSVAV